MREISWLQVSDMVHAQSELLSRCNNLPIYFSKRLCDLLEGRQVDACIAASIAAVHAAMKGQRARECIVLMSDSVRKFDALKIIQRMLGKLRIKGDVRKAAEV